MRRIHRWQRLTLPGLTAILIGAGPPQQPPLVEVAKKGDMEALHALVVEEGVEDVNAAEGDGTTALHWVSHWDDVDAADLLIRAGADVNTANYLGVTPLWPASLHGSTAMVRRLLEAGANPNAALLSGETLVMTAARSGNPDVVRQLLAQGADPNGSAERGQTALMWAATQRHADVVEVLLAYGADVHARSDVWPQLWQSIGGAEVHPDHTMWIQHGGNTPLLLAARVGDLASATVLVAAGADVNDAAAYGISATVLAAHSGNVELIEFLLESGADPNAVAAGYSALHAAILHRNERAVAALLANGADPSLPLLVDTPVRPASPDDLNFHPAWIGATPFWLAARFTQPNVMRLLAEYGADALFEQHVAFWGRGNPSAGYTRATEGTTTALMAATGMGGPGRRYGTADPSDPSEREARTLEAVKLAVELGVDVNVANAEGDRAIDGAIRQGYDSVIEFLEGATARLGPAIGNVER